MATDDVIDQSQEHIRPRRWRQECVMAGLRLGQPSQPLCYNPGMTSEKPRRPFWPRYSLTTLFIVVTVAGCWFGYGLKWIKDRQAFLAREDISVRYGSLPGERLPIMPDTPWSLRLLGEPKRALMTIDVPYWQVAETAQSLFSEAQVTMERPPYTPSK